MQGRGPTALPLRSALDLYPRTECRIGPLESAYSEGMTARRDAVDAWESLYRTSVAVQRHLNERFPDEIGQSEYDVLVNLHHAPSRAARIRDLHRHLLLTQPSVSRLVDRMAARGLVSKCADPIDARGTVVQLTAEGERLFRRVGTAHALVISERMLAALDPAQLRELRRLSDALRGDDAPRRPTEADAVPRSPARGTVTSGPNADPAA